MTKPDPFIAWSPAQLAFALGYRIDLRGEPNGTRSIYLVGPTSRSHPVSYMQAYFGLSRLARIRGLDPATPPIRTPRALINGAER